MQYDRPTVVLGATEQGKSYFVKRTLTKHPHGVLYFNTLHDMADMQGYIEANGKVEFSDLVKALDRGYKINYLPVKNEAIREAELECMFDYMLNRINNEYVFAVDEVHLLEGKNIKRKMKNVSQFGRHSKFYPVWISQRPQQLERPLITQASQVIFFNLNFEDSWLKSYGIPPEQLKAEIAGRPYYSCRWTPGGGLEKAQKIEI